MATSVGKKAKTEEKSKLILEKLLKQEMSDLPFPMLAMIKNLKRRLNDLHDLKEGKRGPTNLDALNPNEFDLADFRNKDGRI